MGTPKYARFRRADLQMQTPLDRRHWVGASLDEGGAGLPSHGQVTEDEIRLSAQRYAARCREVGLEIIGLTDHNLGGPVDEVEVFVEELRAHLAGDAIVLVGFEVAAKVGKGAHFLCLFDRSMSVRDVSDVLTELGLPPASRFAGGEPAQASRDWPALPETVQNDRGGILVAAHAIDKNGLCSDKTVADWWSKELIGDLRLGCIELPKHREYYADPARSWLASKIVRGEDGWGGGRHPIAVVNSSDCKRLDPKDRRSPSTNQTESWIGKRWTWIKTGPDVTVEGLRQAFLDHESRIRTVADSGDLAAPRPGDEPNRPVVETVVISGASFLADQSIALSPELTTLIGGGGTGKSSILEYVGRALGVESPNDDRPDVVAETLGEQGQARITSRNGVDRLALTLSRSGTEVDDEPLPVDVAARFPIRLVRQREIFAIATSKDARLRLVDDLVRDELRQLEGGEADVLRNLASLEKDRSDREELLARRAVVTAEISRFEGQIVALQQASTPLVNRDRLRAERDLLSGLDARIAELATDIDSAADELVLAVSTAEIVTRQTPHVAALIQVHARALQKVADVQAHVRGAAHSLRAWLDSERSRDERKEWSTALADAEAAYAEASAALPEAASVPGLGESLTARKAELVTIDAKVVAIERRLANEPALMLELRELWAAQTDTRRAVASRLEDVVPETDKHTPYVTVAVDAFGDIAALGDWVMGRVNDQRRFAPDEAKALARILAAARQPGENPVEVLCSLLADQARSELDAEFSPARMAALRDVCEGAPRKELERFRVPDSVTVTLYRQGGEVAGTLGAGLSVGQQCIAVLTLLLAMGDTPILIDQPEDEIDNEFIYRELVPLIVRAKQRRQVIIATHNANIPVNGDAELIYALEAGQVDGEVRGVRKALKWKDPVPGQGVAEGPLEVEAVRRAVSEIMEGSEEAFQRRRAKYGLP